MRKITEVGENIILAVSGYMDTGLREKVAIELAPCTTAEFLTRYCELEPTFEELLKNEFGIEL